MAKRWQRDLEIHVPADKEVNPDTMAEFNSKNTDKLKEIEQFIMIFNDWH